MTRATAAKSLSVCAQVLLGCWFFGWHATSILAFGTLPASVEEVVPESDLIVLGRVASTDPEGIQVGGMSVVFTRHAFKVEACYKGSGPDEITLLMRGGFWTQREGGKEEKHFTQAGGAEGVNFLTETEPAKDLRARIEELDSGKRTSRF